MDELTDLVDRRIARDLANVDGVAQVNRIGGKDREVRIDLDPARLQAYNITATEVNEQVRNLNLNLSGAIESRRRRTKYSYHWQCSNRQKFSELSHYSQ